MKWDMGRQGTGYEKKLLLTGRWPLPFDCYLLRYREGSMIPSHVDPVQAGKHFRLNIVLKAAKKGGEFICKNPIFQTRRIKLFRPDVSEHSVVVVAEGVRYVLSIGWIIA